MKVMEDGSVILEYLSAANPSSVGDDAPITLKTPAPFPAANAPGEANENNMQHIENLGRNAVVSFKQAFSIK